MSKATSVVPVGRILEVVLTLGQVEVAGCIGVGQVRNDDVTVVERDVHGRRVSAEVDHAHLRDAVLRARRVDEDLWLDGRQGVRGGDGGHRAGREL